MKPTPENPDVVQETPAAPSPPTSDASPPEAPEHAPDPAARVRAGGIAEYDYSNFYSGSGEDAFVMLEPFDDWWQDARPWGYYQFGLPMNTAPTPRINIVETKNNTELKGLINLASYNYLGLSYRPEVIEAAKAALDVYGLGASGSPILSGTFDLHEQFREELARFKNKESVMLFPTGYSANLGAIAGLMRPGDWVIADQYAHASVVDGIILSKANTRFFRHNDVNDLEKKLKKATGKKLVVVEGVYSMDGDVCPLPEIVEVCQRHGARIMLDEAHSAFLFGENGRGVAEHFGLEDAVDIHMGTFSKSLGGIGGYIAGTRKLTQYIRGFARSHVFSCAMPPTIAAGLLRALELMRSEPQLRERLWDNVAFLQSELRRDGVDIGDSASQVVPIMVRDDDKIFGISEELLHEGVYLQPIRYPAVGKHRSRLRISVSAAHNREELAEGARIIAHVLRRHGICP
ncbi:MAG: aminotransferase class I/II-fold pyridoxal phosphate-dependent enzyme [Gemmatimonadetes bacterium]|nr:aminotransferase class I/II-fold pyridoxal phosphate-dependent enzyme [Gemmatimonadota bacterium]